MKSTEVHAYTQQIEMLTATRRRGDQYYADELWDYEQIMRLESFLFDPENRSEVTLGDFELIEEAQDREDDN